MRLTKRQLKRIIREEYSRLKRRGLLREMSLDPSMRGKIKELVSTGDIESIAQADMLLKSLGGPDDIYSFLPMHVGGHYVDTPDPSDAQEAIKFAKQMGIPNPRAVAQAPMLRGPRGVVISDDRGRLYLPYEYETYFQGKSVIDLPQIFDEFVDVGYRSQYHAEVDQEFVTIGQKTMQLEQLALEFDPRCNVANFSDLMSCVAMALKQRGVRTVVDYEQPGKVIKIDEFIKLVSHM